MSYVQSSSGTPLDASEMHSLTLVTERPNCAMSAKQRLLHRPRRQSLRWAGARVTASAQRAPAAPQGPLLPQAQPRAPPRWSW